MLKRSYLPAQKVEKAVSKLLKDFPDDVYSYPHINGREKGFQLVMLTPIIDNTTRLSIYIYEHKSSDNLCMTVSYGSNNWDTVTEEEYSKTKHFSYNQVTEIAKAIVKQFESVLEPA